MRADVDDCPASNDEDEGMEDGKGLAPIESVVARLELGGAI